MEHTIEKVAGGYHASDPALRVTVFGRTEDEALQALDESRKRAVRLDVIAIAQGGTAQRGDKNKASDEHGKEETENHKAG